MKQLGLQWVITMDGLLNRPNKAQTQGPRGQSNCLKWLLTFFFLFESQSNDFKEMQNGHKKPKKDYKEMQNSQKRASKETPNMQK